jgi:hypothetical protein
MFALILAFVLHLAALFFALETGRAVGENEPDTDLSLGVILTVAAFLSAFALQVMP